MTTPYQTFLFFALPAIPLLLLALSLLLLRPYRISGRGRPASKVYLYQLVSRQSANRPRPVNKPLCQVLTDSYGNFTFSATRGRFLISPHFPLTPSAKKSAQSIKLTFWHRRQQIKTLI